MTCSKASDSSRVTRPLAALPFDAHWAAKEAKLCRARLFNRGLRLPFVDDSEFSSFVALIWWRVCCGEIGGFQARTDKPLVAQVQAYVAACLDNELIRYIQQEGNPNAVNLPKGRQDIMSRVDPCEEEGPVHDALIDHGDPLALLLARESANEACADLPEWPGPVGELMTPWWHEARDMDETLARQCKARLESETGTGQDRVNWAWVLIHAAHRVDARRTHQLAPMLCARWLDRSTQSPKTLLAQIYPGLGSSASVEDVSRQEMRGVLRMLAMEKLGDCAVSPQHLWQVTQDAALSMSRWVGARGPYKKQSSSNPKASDLVAA